MDGQPYHSKTEGFKVANDKKTKTNKETPPEQVQGKVKFEVYGEEMIEKRVKLSGNSGRVYLPPDWVGHHVKIIRID
jgi:putative transposon-encoded protein